MQITGKNLNFLKSYPLRDFDKNTKNITSKLEDKKSKDNQQNNSENQEEELREYFSYNKDEHKELKDNAKDPFYDQIRSYNELQKNEEEDKLRNLRIDILV